MDAHSGKQLLRASLLGAICGWAIVAWPWPLETPSVQLTQHGLDQLAAVSIAGLVAIAFVHPLLRKAIGRRLSFRQSAVWGATVSTVFVLLTIIVGGTGGWLQSLDESSWSQLGGGDYIRAIGTMPTPYGWQVLAQNAAIFAVWCTMGAVLIRLMVAPGKDSNV